MLGDFVEKQETFFYFNKPCSLKSKTWHFLLLLVKKCQFFVYLDLVKRRLEIMLNDFAEKKETFFAIKNRIFQSLKNRIFPKGLTHGFGQNMPIFFFL